MCTIVLFQRVHPTYPVVVAANRDEFYARPTSPPRVLHHDPRVVGGRDEQSGGTWLGVTAGGLFVALTNQRTFTGPDRNLRSRGEVVVDALRAGDPDAVASALAAVDPRAYNPFNLVFGDAGGLRVAYAHDGATHVTVEPVPDGVHVLPNGRLDSPAFAKTARARALAPADGSLDALAELLGDHERPALADIPAPPAGSLLPREVLRELQALCIHTAAYGTKSAAIVALAPGRVARYLYADGASCSTAFADVTALVTSPAPRANP